MPEVIFEPNSDIYIAYWEVYPPASYYHEQVNHDGDEKFIMGSEDAVWRDIRFGIDMSGFDPTGRSINFIKVQFRGFTDDTQAKALIRCGSGGSDPWFTDYGSPVVLVNTPTNYEQAWTLNPCVTQQWEFADIEKLHIGISGKGHYHLYEHTWYTPICSRVKLLVDYNDWITPPPETTSGFFMM